MLQAKWSFALLLTMLFLGIARTGHAQDWSTVHRDTSDFPQNWVGDWAGTLQIHFPGVAAREVPMRLEIHPRDSVSWDWTLIYNQGEKEDRRAYSLVASKPDQGEWLIDEHNGIVLGARVIGPVFVSRFSVDGQLLLARYDLREGVLHFEILAGSMDVTETGGPQEGEAPLEQTPFVHWYGLNVFQQATLYNVSD